MLSAKRIVLEVLAPQSYYAWADVDLRSLEMQLDHEVGLFSKRWNAGVVLSFRFMVFTTDFIYRPGMDCELIRDAVRHRITPFANRQ